MNLRKGVELLLDLPDRAAVIYTDPTRLGQVVNNLINNAVKFTAEGRITIGYRLKDFATLEVFVEDTGIGMSEEVLAHIFERFYKGECFCAGHGIGIGDFAGLSLKGFMAKIEVASTSRQRGAALQLSFRRKCGSSVLFPWILMQLCERMILYNVKIATFAVLNDKFIDTMISVEGLKGEFKCHSSVRRRLLCYQ